MVEIKFCDIIIVKSNFHYSMTPFSCLKDVAFLRETERPKALKVFTLPAALLLSFTQTYSHHMLKIRTFMTQKSQADFFYCIAQSLLLPL